MMPPISIFELSSSQSSREPIFHKCLTLRNRCQWRWSQERSLLRTSRSAHAPHTCYFFPMRLHSQNWVRPRWPELHELWEGLWTSCPATALEPWQRPNNQLHKATHWKWKWNGYFSSRCVDGGCARSEVFIIGCLDIKRQLDEGSSSVLGGLTSPLSPSLMDRCSTAANISIYPLSRRENSRSDTWIGN